MARPKKSGKRATGIQGRSGYLYIIKNNYIIKDGSKTFEKQWISTGLKDTPENIKKASEMRSRLLNKKEVKSTDRNISLSKYADGFLGKKKREVSDTTLSSYFYRTNRIKNYFGDTKVKDVNETMVENFLDDMFTAYHVQYRTVKDTKVLLSSILEQAVKEGLIASNPAKEVVINKNLANKYAKEKDTDEEFFSYEEAQHFLDVIKDHELYELFYVTLFFGLRREELLGLRWSALDFKNKTMSINHTVTRGTVINRVNSTKTDSSAREYPLTDEQIAMFKRLKEKETEYRQLCGNNYYESDYIFKHVDGSLLVP